MPSIKAYTPYETLAFCQSVAYHGSDTAAFEDISTALNGNQLIRESETYDQTRLTAAALHALYYDLLAEEKNTQGTPTVNGDNGSTNGTNPRKRKLSMSPAPPDDEQMDEQRLLQSLVDKLYARFKEQMIKEIRQEEEDYLRLQAEIAELEKEEDDEQDQQLDAATVNNSAQIQVEPPKTAEDTAPKVPVVQASPKTAATSVPPGVDANRVEQIASNTAPPAADTKPSPSLLRSGLQQPLAPSHSPTPSTPALLPSKASVEPAQSRASQPPPAQPPQHSPGAFHRTLPIPSPQRPNYGSINPQHFQPGPHGQPVPVLPQYAGSPHMPPPTEYPPQKRGSSLSTHGRGSPVPGQLQQQPYPGYPGYPQQAPWPHQVPTQQQHAQPPPYQNQPYYVQSPQGRPAMQYQTPHHAAYAPYPQSAPIHYQGQPPPPHAWPQSQPGQPYYGYHGSANVTPVLRTDSKHVEPRGRSSTPWKRRAQPTSGVRPSSPTRPERDISPISDTESPTQAAKARKSPGKADQRTEESRTVLRGAAPQARGREQASATPSAFAGSRSQSIASFASDTPTGKRRKGRATQKIKAEPPSTPAAIPSDTEQQPQRTTGLRARPHASTLTSKIDSIRPPTTTTTAGKRKRSPGRASSSPPPSIARRLPSPATTAATRLQQPSLRRQFSLSLSHDPSLVAVSRNFTKTSQLLLNEIVSYKLAGIFAKPLSERDAPGYKDLVLRPQDLKSIKAAITKGGKAALAAIETFEETTSEDANAGKEEESGEKTPTRNAPNTTPSDGAAGTGERTLGNGVFLVKASEELVPPKGIVNSAQLEMELVRMFANAVMFNPLPSAERGFGRSLRLRKRGGDVAPLANESEDGKGDQQADSSESDEGTPVEEGGIISDTREMFEDIMSMVRKWREVEVERLGNMGDADPIASTPIAGPSKSGSGAHLGVPAPVEMQASTRVRTLASDILRAWRTRRRPGRRTLLPPMRRGVGRREKEGALRAISGLP